MGIFIITFVAAAVVALLGLWSARNAHVESEARKQWTARAQQAAEKRDKNTEDRNQDNPAAMAMAGPTGPTSANPAR
jgi:hypothetical protein